MAEKKNAASEPVEAAEPYVAEPEAVAAPVAPAAKYDFTKLNTLAVVSIATAVTGFGAIAGVITGHIALAQVKQTGQKGRALALAGVIVGYAGIAFAILGGVARIIGALVGPRYGIQVDGGIRDFGHGGMMGGWDDQNGGSQGGSDNGFVNPGGCPQNPGLSTMPGGTNSSVPAPCVTPQA
jgi:hypothetical protein